MPCTGSQFKRVVRYKPSSEEQYKRGAEDGWHRKAGVLAGEAVHMRLELEKQAKERKAAKKSRVCKSAS